MEGRPDKEPGRFKTEANRVRSTVFVTPELVAGTLSKGFEIYRSLAAPLQRSRRRGHPPGVHCVYDFQPFC
jgi:hypothetical protein